MCFEILPTAFIKVTAMAVPTYAIYTIHKLTLNNPYRRDMDERFNRAMYLRDKRLTGNPYNMSGLEAISDECEEEKGKKGSQNGDGEEGETDGNCKKGDKYGIEKKEEIPDGIIADSRDEGKIKGNVDSQDDKCVKQDKRNK